MSADRMPISRGIAPLADIPDREGGDGGPEADGRRESGARHSRATISERDEDVSGRRYDKTFGTPE